MSGLSDIPVRIEGMAPIGNALPILHEVATRLARLIEHGESATIDLRAMPLAPGDYETLQRLLGEGEVNATLEALGPSRVRETAIHGVWWVTHCNTAGETVAEFIEITRLPELLQTIEADLAEGLSRLRETLLQQASPSAETNPAERDPGMPATGA